MCSKRNQSEVTEHLLLPLVNELFPSLDADLHSCPLNHAAYVTLGDSTPLVPLSLQASLVYRLPYFPLHFNHSHVYQATLSISGGQGGVIHQPI